MIGTLGKQKIGFAELVFYIGVFLLPFDNLVIAPSSGWAAIAPFVFFAYIIFSLKYIKIRLNALIWSVIIVVLTSFCYVVYNPTLSAVIDTVSTLFLGICFYFAFYIHFVVKKNSPKLFLRVLTLAYFISFLYGLAFLMGIQFIEKIMITIEKRHSGRLQYTFTEPSFISMHLFGVILPCIIVFKKRDVEIFGLKTLLVLFIIVTLVFGQSTRFVLDTAIVIVLYFLCRFFQSKLNLKKISLLFVGIGVIVVAWILVNKDPRLSTIIEKGVYADGSLASRWFRINAIIKGMIQKPISMIFGFGLGNASVPFNLGYDLAFAEYSSKYLEEIIALKGTTGTSFFCGHIRVMAEVGIIFYILLLVGLIKTDNKKYRSWFMILLVFYLYLQFDSYAFYTVWLFLFNKSYKYGDCFKDSNGEIITSNR